MTPPGHRCPRRSRSRTIFAGAGRTVSTVCDRGSSLKGVAVMSVSIRPLRGSFAGEVSWLDITRPLGAADVAAVEAGMDTYAVLVFREQHLTDEQQIAFTRNFGELENYQSAGHIRKREDHRLGPGM